MTGRGSSPKACVVCQRDFVAKGNNQKLCGRKECKLRRIAEFRNPEKQAAYKRANRVKINAGRRARYASDPSLAARDNFRRKEKYHSDPAVASRAREQRKAWRNRNKYRTELMAYRHAAAKATRVLLKTCPHCGGEVSVKAWKEVQNGNA